MIAGHDDITVQQYTDLGYQIIIYATTPIITAAMAMVDAYQSLKDTGSIGIDATEVAARRRKVEALISLPEYYEVEAATTEKAYQDRERAPT